MRYSSIRRTPRPNPWPADGPAGPAASSDPIDAAIDTPRTRPILAPDEPGEFFAKPSAIADEMFRVAHQDRSTWSFRVELRRFCENW